ncbi:hypothetical protein EMPS_05731 [Entomortierella parvispora]|uniref:Uncharacterized protein n=1 Tax=Entomortierella parvispora TaxID=205924 RepID=A0A9P3LWS3_9FUNG|nr:hypothetical protein EMPS_05731 [Entomortierella parvispora]
MSATAAASWRSRVTNVPALTKTLATVMTAATALDLLLRFRDMAIASRGGENSDNADAEQRLVSLLAMVPVNAPYRFWTFATAAFFERNIVMYAINIFILLSSGKYLERGWGSREFFKYVAITSIGPMLWIYFTCLFEFVVRGNDELLFDTQAYGLTSVIAGFVISFKQLMPDHVITFWGFLSMRVGSVPLLYTIIMIIQAIITREQIQLLLALYGLSLAWLYSRFMRVQDGIRGDRGENFSFASFFPEFVQPPVKAISNFFFGILVKLHLFSPIGYGGSFQYDLENPQMAGMGHTFTQPGSLRAEAERRRALALKALDMRLHAAAGNHTHFSGPGRSSHKGGMGSHPGAAPVSLLSLSAEPLHEEDEEEDEVLFETSALDVNESSASVTEKTRTD